MLISSTVGVGALQVGLIAMRNSSADSAIVDLEEHPSPSTFEQQLEQYKLQGSVLEEHWTSC